MGSGRVSRSGANLGSTRGVVVMAKLKNPDAGLESEKADAGPVETEAVGTIRSYSVRQRTEPEGAAVVVESPDGTPEDAVRMFNARRGGEIRTMKQLILVQI